MAQPCTKEGEIARNGQRLEDLEKRAEERRQADIDIFRKLEEINRNIGDFKEEINNKIGDLKTAQAITSLKMVGLGIGGGAIPAIVTLILLLLTGKI